MASSLLVVASLVFLIWTVIWDICLDRCLTAGSTLGLPGLGGLESLMTLKEHLAAERIAWLVRESNEETFSGEEGSPRDSKREAKVLASIEE